jgi:hypothetical protein
MKAVTPKKLGRRAKAKAGASAPTVAKLIKRSQAQFGAYTATLKPGESMLSYNKVTGCSVNFPIAETCSPSKLCIKTCYFARGGPSWPESLKKQYRLYNSVKADPDAAAKRLADEIHRKFRKPTFLRWNGGGDLFPESVRMLNTFAQLCPELPIWVVTRLPVHAAEVEQAPNVFVHFSLDMHSKERRDAFESLPKKTTNYFYSYQCDRGEFPDAKQLAGISVLFYDWYKPPATYPAIADEVICPLNKEADITGVCEWCRRCFNGKAVKHSFRHPLNHRLEKGAAPS